jgi:hypothetical protein
MRKSVQTALKKRIGSFIPPDSFVKSLRSDVVTLYNAISEAEKEQNLPELVNEREGLSSASELLRIIADEDDTTK